MKKKRKADVLDDLHVRIPIDMSSIFRQDAKTEGRKISAHLYKILQSHYQQKKETQCQD